MSDILSSPCWVKATSIAEPAFRRAYSLYVDERDQFGGYLMRQLLNISADDFLVAMVNPDEIPVFSPTGASAKTLATPADVTPAGEKPASPAGFPYMLALPFIVTPGVCDDDVGDAGSTRAEGTGAPVGPRRSCCMAESAVTTLIDMVTSFHIIIANFPQLNGHVSLSIQANHMGKMECGKTYLVISRVDKMGRRIVYTSVDFVEPQLQPVHDAHEAPLPMNTTAELLTAVKSATVLANVKHVKSMLSFS